MKANVPEKIWIDTKNDLPKLSGHIDKDSVEYIRKDAFIEKAKEFIWSHTEGSDYHVNYVLKEFEKYMKGKKYMRCPECGGELKETEGVTYGGKHAYSCIVCGYKGWLYKQD